MIDVLIQSDVVARLGVVLLHVTWQGFALGALMSVCLAALGGQANRARYMVAVGTMALLALSPPVTWWVLPPTSTPITSSASEIGAGLPGWSIDSAVPEVAPGGRADAGQHAAISDRAPMLGRVRAAYSSVAALVMRISPWLAVLWGLGVACLSVNLFGGFLALRRRRLAATFASEDLRRRCAALATRMGITAPVELRVSSRIDSPCTFGLFRPVILLPVSIATGLSVDRLELILAHELAHIQRHDYAVNFLQALVETLLFYHPAVWWVSRVVRREREHICDSLALEATGGNRVEYVQTLLSLEEARASLSLAASEAPLLTRARRILGASATSRTAFPTLLAPILAFSLLVTLAAGLVLAQSSDSENASVANDRIAEVTERFGIPSMRFVWATVIGDVQWREEVDGLGPPLWISFPDDGLVVLEERSEDFVRSVRISKGVRTSVDDTELPEFEYLFESPRGSVRPPNGELEAWVETTLESAYAPDEIGDITRGKTYDSMVMSVMLGDDIPDLHKQVLRYAEGTHFNALLASQAMQLHSADFADDAFLAEVIRTNIARLERYMPTGPGARTPHLEPYVPWMLLTANEIESDELRLEILTEVAQFAMQPGSE